ncbi:MAG TPA: PAS domain S-box protein, partial [Longimicrobium sp.]|nr:PAS domain S-box protein [Longimicrobium sp.]
MPFTNTIPRPPRAAPKATRSSDTMYPRPRHARRDLILLLLGTAAFVTVASAMEWFEGFSEWSRVHEHWQVDELVLCAAAFSSVVGIFAVRRWAELRRAMTRREQAERELAATRTHHQHLLDASPVVIFAVAVEGEAITSSWISGNLERIVGYAPHEVVSREWWLERVHPDDRDAARRCAGVVLTAGKAVHEFRFLRASGEYLRLREELRLVRGGPPGPARVVGSWSDVTELHERETRYQLVVESASDAIVSVDRDGKIVFANPATERIFGYTPAELEGTPLSRLMPERMRERHGAAFAKYTATGERTFPWERVEFPGLHRSGREVSLELSFGAPAGGRFTTAVIRDLTERDHATAELRQAEQRAQRVAERMKALATAGAGVIAAQTADELRQAIHDACLGIIPFEALLLARYIPERDALWYVGAVDAGTWGEPVEVTVRGRPSARVIDERRSLLTLSSDDPAAAGSHLTLNGRRSESIIRTPVLTAEGVIGLLSVQSYQRDAYDAEDVEVLETLAALAAPAMLNLQLLADLRSSEAALRESEARFRMVVDSLGEALFITDLQERIEYTNPRASQLLGYTPRELARSRWGDHFVEPESHPPMLERIAERRAGVSGRYQLAMRHRDGTVVWSEVVASPLRNAAGAVVGTVGAVNDITERRRAELEARDARARAERMAERMAAVARAASGFMGAGSVVELRDVVRDACTGVLPCDALTFGLYDEGAGQLHFLGDFDTDIVFQPRSVAVAGTPCERVLRERRTLVTHRSTDPAGAG